MKNTKKLLCLLLIALLSLGALASCAGGKDSSTSASDTSASITDTAAPEETENPAFGNSMKIPYPSDLSPEDGADSVERDGDHQNSPYFKAPDFYNVRSGGSLVILEHFKTMQQTSEWACGVTSALMMINHFGKLGTHDENSLAAFRGQRDKGDGTTTGGTTGGATNMQQMIDIFNGVGGFTMKTTRDYTNEAGKIQVELSEFKALLEAGYAIAIGDNDWGGHWKVLIGYDDMGTPDYEGDDVIIYADPYDTTDHCQDGYLIMSAERWYYNFTFYNFFKGEGAENNKCFVAIKLAA